MGIRVLNRRSSREAMDSLLADAEVRRNEQLRRLATAAALEVHGGVAPVAAWDLAGQMPDDVRIKICIAGRNAISQRACREVRAIVARWRTGGPKSYPLFAEPPEAAELASEQGGSLGQTQTEKAGLG